MFDLEHYIFNSKKMFDLEYYIMELRKSELNDVPEV